MVANFTYLHVFSDILSICLIFSFLVTCKRLNKQTKQSHIIWNTPHSCLTYNLSMENSVPDVITADIQKSVKNTRMPENKFYSTNATSPGWGCRIHRLHLCRKVRPPQRVSWYDIKQSDGEVPAVLELWGMRSIPSLLSLPGPLWPGVVAPDKGPIYGLNRTKSILMLNWIVWVNWIGWNKNVFDN